MADENNMTAKELAERMEIPYMTFILKIKPHLEGKIDDKQETGLKGKINDWKKAGYL